MGDWLNTISTIVKPVSLRANGEDIIVKNNTDSSSVLAFNSDSNLDTVSFSTNNDISTIVNAKNNEKNNANNNGNSIVSAKNNENISIIVEQNKNSYTIIGNNKTATQIVAPGSNGSNITGNIITEEEARDIAIGLANKITAHPIYFQRILEQLVGLTKSEIALIANKYEYMYEGSLKEALNSLVAEDSSFKKVVECIFNGGTASKANMNIDYIALAEKIKNTDNPATLFNNLCGLTAAQAEELIKQCPEIRTRIAEIVKDDKYGEVYKEILENALKGEYANGASEPSNNSGYSNGYGGITTLPAYPNNGYGGITTLPAYPNNGYGGITTLPVYSSPVYFL